MPRGKQSKAVRVHNRACASGRSTRGSSYTAQSQRGGKKYKKGQTSQTGECEHKIQTKIIYGGVEYHIVLSGDLNDQLICHGVYDRRKMICSLGIGKGININQAKITDETLMKNVMGMYLFKQENPEMYEVIKAYEPNML
jgi:hypothetical protein